MIIDRLTELKSIIEQNYLNLDKQLLIKIIGTSTVTVSLLYIGY